MAFLKVDFNVAVCGSQNEHWTVEKKSIYVVILFFLGNDFLSQAKPENTEHIQQCLFNMA